MKRSFVFNAKFLKEIDTLPSKKQLELFRMIADYGLLGEKPEAFSDDDVNVAWSRVYEIFLQQEKKKKIPENMFESEEEEQFYVYMSSAYPELYKFDYPLTLTQYKQLKSEYKKESVDEKIASLNNMRGAHKKYSSVFSTVRNWLRRAESSGGV